MSTRFEHVSIAEKANIYFDGKCISYTDPQLARGPGAALEHSLNARAGYAFTKGERLLRVDLKPLGPS